MWQLYNVHIGRALLASLLVATIVSVGMILGWQTAPLREFNEARDEWLNDPIPRYRLVIERPSLHCQQNVVIQNERIIEIIEDTCPIELLTMTDLYDRIGRLDGLASVTRFPTGMCGCEWELNAHITYDHANGYPAQVAISDRRTIDWTERSCWQHFVVNGEFPECDVPFLFGQPRITNVSIIPMP